MRYFNYKNKCFSKKRSTLFLKEKMHLTKKEKNEHVALSQWIIQNFSPTVQTNNTIFFFYNKVEDWILNFYYTIQISHD
jgi:hypothetical protein